MKRSATWALALAVAACSPSENDQSDVPGEASPGELSETLPDSVTEEALRAWQVRLDDESAGGGDGLRVVVEDGALHATTGAAGLAWQPADQVLGGDFEVSASFDRPAAGGAALGLFVGGRRLTDPDLAYTSFLVSSDGRYRIVRTEGGDERELAPWAPLPSGGAPVADAPARRPRLLAVRVEGEEVHFLVDEEPVETLAVDEVQPHGTLGLRLEAGVEADVREWKVVESEGAGAPDDVSPPGDASASGSPS